MRVLFVTGEFPPLVGGVGDYTDRLAGALSARGEEVHVFTTRPLTEVTGARNEDAVWAVRADTSIYRVVHRWSAGAWSQLKSHVRRLRPDVVHFQFQAGAYGLRGAITLWPALLRSWAIRPLVVTTFHDLLPPHWFPLSGRLGLDARAPLWMARASDATVVTNRVDEQALKAQGAGSLWRIPIGANILPPSERIDRRAWRLHRNASDDDLVIANFGFSNRSKGLGDLLQACRELAAQSVPFRLILVGGGVGVSDPTNAHVHNELMDAMSRLGLAGRVVITGYEAARSVSADLLAADLVVLPYREGYSLRRGTLLAALAHGCAIVTTEPASGM
ncbi:MAG: glycosyltransferase family 4 protein, partial [Chloroflexi bacterium]|nr:glycosyltransferase family 4 protein [Chloroflexota bacterium]